MIPFFEKLKKGMGAEALPEEKKIKKPKPTEKKGEPKKLEIKTKPIELVELKVEKDYNPPTTSSHSPNGERAPEKLEKERKKPSFAKATEDKGKRFEPAHQSFAWQNLGGPEGELAVDVYQTEKDLVIQATIAGVRPEELDISIENDIITIRGNRERPGEQKERNYFYQECYWGPFSRQIISPEEIDPSRTQASMKEGVLTIRIPKIERKKKRKIEIKG